MVFKRRERLSTARWIQQWIYPRTGWRRALEYFGHRLKRLPDTPHKISLGIACGAFVSFSPLFGLHFVYASILAMLLRGNVLAACLGTLFGNPLTFPFIVTMSLSLGRRIMGTGGGHAHFASVKESFFGAFTGLWDSFLSIFGLAEPAWGRLAVFWSELFVPYLVGGIVPGLIAGAAAYFLARPIVAAYQLRRRSKLIKRTQERLARKKAERAAAAMAKEGSS